MKGLFVTFEGMDCSGKSTQLKLLADWLRQEGRDVLITREPGGTPLAEQMRNMLLEYKGEERITPQAELLLFSAARAQHVANVIVPHLEKGGVVLCDRFYDSTTAYQGFARGLDMVVIDELNDFCTGGRHPDLTFLLDITLQESRRRLALRSGEAEPDRLEEEDNAFHERVRLGFLAIAEHFPERFKVINAKDSVLNITMQIREETLNALKRI